MKFALSTKPLTSGGARNIVYWSQKNISNKLIYKIFKKILQLHVF